jgi:hypothetical protein
MSDKALSGLSSEKGDENLTYKAVKIVAKEGRSMSIHMTYSNVTDI